MVKSVIDGRECGFLNSAGGMESGRLVLQVGFGLKTGFLGVCAFVPFFAIARTFKQKCGVSREMRCAGVRADFWWDLVGFTGWLGLGECAFVRACTRAKKVRVLSGCWGPADQEKGRSRFADAGEFLGKIAFPWHCLFL